jgi:Domain of unknown function (DUF4190)
MSDSNQRIGKWPEEDYLIEANGRINGWVPGEGWTPTQEAAPPEAVNLLRQMGAGPATWNIQNRPLYRDPRLASIPRPPEVPRINGLASTARTFSFLGVLLIPCALIGAICGHIALGQIRKDDIGSRSVAVTAITVGWVIMGLWLILIVFILSHS